MTSNKTKHLSIKLSVDLLVVSRRYLEFIRRHLNTLDLRREDVLKAALYRYQHFWLPLAAKHPEKHIEAPLDIDWVWHCHMLSPLPYCDDCEQLVGRVVGNESLIRTDEENAEALKVAEKLWAEAYPPEHPFQVDITGPVNPEYRDGEINFKAHILSNALRQKEFDYQVSLPHYDDPGYIMSSAIRYKQFLYLRKMNPDMWVIPSYDVDFVWHAHMLCPLQYKGDMLRNLGCGFNHGDVPPGLPPDAKLHYPDLITKAAWVEEFGESVSLFGAGYRGENPIGKLDVLDTDELAFLAPRDVTLTINKVSVTTNRVLSKSSKVKLETPLGHQKIPLHLREETKRKSRSRKAGILGSHKNNSSCVRFDTSKNDNCILNVTLLDKKGWGRSSPGDSSDEIKVDMNSFVAVLRRDTQVPFETVLEFDELTKLTIDATAEPIKFGRAKFTIRPGTKDQVAMTEDLRSMWGPIPLPEEPLGSKDVPVNRITFKILDVKEQVAFAVRLLESKALDQDGSQVFFHDKMVAVANAIGGVQLPYPSHVSNKKATATLNPVKGEKGALVKNTHGDWGIAIGSLHQEKPMPLNGLNGNGRPAQPVEREVMHLTVWLVKEKERFEFKLPNDKNEHEICLKGVKINLSTGSIEIDHPDSPVAECMAMAFYLKLLWRHCKVGGQSMEKIPISKLAKMGKKIILGNSVADAVKAFQGQGKPWGKLLNKSE